MTTASLGGVVPLSVAVHDVSRHLMAAAANNLKRT